MRSGLDDLRSGTWQGKHEPFQSRLLEMMIGGKGLGNTTPLHNDEGEAIRQAPVLVRAAPVQADSGASEIRIEGNHLDQASA